MNSQHRQIRNAISAMSPERAEDFIKAFHLPKKEEDCIIEKEVRDLSYVQICEKYRYSLESIKEARQRAFAKMADAIAYRQEKGRE